MKPAAQFPRSCLLNTAGFQTVQPERLAIHGRKQINGLGAADREVHPHQGGRTIPVAFKHKEMAK